MDGWLDASSAVLGTAHEAATPPLISSFFCYFNTLSRRTANLIRTRHKRVKWQTWVVMRKSVIFLSMTFTYISITSVHLLLAVGNVKALGTKPPSARGEVCDASRLRLHGQPQRSLPIPEVLPEVSACFSCLLGGSGFWKASRDGCDSHPHPLLLLLLSAFFFHVDGEGHR